MLKAPTSRSLLLSATLACGACASGTPIVTARAAGCSALVPDQWKQGTAGAQLPQGATVGDWVAFGDAQRGKLDQANARTKDVIEITERCEARDAAALKRARRGWLAQVFD